MKMSIAEQLPKLSLEELRTLNHQIVGIIKLKSFTSNANAITNLEVKMKVKVKRFDSKLSGLIGTVISLRRVKAVVDFGVAGKWVIPASNLEEVK